VVLPGTRGPDAADAITQRCKRREDTMADKPKKTMKKTGKSSLANVKGGATTIIKKTWK
jgi:hypothetical protein